MKRFLALSRSTHGVLDLAMPGFVALLWLGGFPDWQVLGLCLLTGLAGYTAIYALNDLIGVRDDREKVAVTGLKPGYSVESSHMRYPLAQNLISLRGALAWFGFWYALTLVGAYLLNPWLILIVVAATVLEVIYCKLLKVTWWRTVVSGFVKAAGPIAAVFVVVPAPSPPLLLLLLLWLMLWEIGGQNIPADWNDIDEDRKVGARTIPLVFGPRVASILVVTTLALTVIVSLFLPRMSPLALGLPFQLATLAAGCVLLLLPGMRLFRSLDGRHAARLFDRASLYPLAQLLIVLVFVFV